MELLKAFLAHSDGIKIVTTSSERLSFRRPRYIKFELGPLREEAAVCLLANICRNEVSVGNIILQKIASHCYYHPSALCLVASWL